MPAEYVHGRTGAKLLMLDGFTFYKKNHQAHGRKQWYCSSRDMFGCKSDVITYQGYDGLEYISIFRGRHIHDRPKLKVSQDGRYIKDSN